MDISISQMDKLEQAHRFMTKSAQGILDCTPDTGVLAQVGWVTVEGHLDKKGKLLLWNILALPVNSVVKQVAIIHFYYEEVDAMIPLVSIMRNIYKNVQKYGLDR